MKQVFVFVFLFVIKIASSSAQLKLPAIFSDNMVLQQETTVNIWGWAKASSTVFIKASWGSEMIKVTVGKDGKWTARLKTTKNQAKSVQIEIINNEETKVIRNILLGEVWLCSGQSNMDFPISKSIGWRTGIVNQEEEMKDANYPEIRFFQVKQHLSPFKELEDCKGEWKVVSADNIKDFSAVAFFFGRTVYKSIKQPIGLIQSTWGGTHAESWTKMEYMKNHALYQPQLEQQQDHFDRFPMDSLRYVADKNAFDLAITSDSSLVVPKKPQHPSNNKTLSTLWNAMINPIVPYTLKGVIWYQGESNSIRSEEYNAVFSTLIRSWRKEWQQRELPFYFVQIAPHYKQDPLIREAQLDTWNSIENTGMAVITDAGDSTDIHPRNKRIPGERLAYWALGKTYGKKLSYSGPLYKSVYYQDSKAIVDFDYVQDGLWAKGGSLIGFELAGRDGIFHKATATVQQSQVIVESEDVSEPKYVRYGWGKFFSVNLYNKYGLPASPFRSSVNY